MNKKSLNISIRMLCEGAITVAMAQALGYLKLYELPWGGSVSLAMLPIFLFCVRWGLVPGLLVSFVFSILQVLFDGGFAISWMSIIGDYVLAYTVLGLAGIVKGSKKALLIGTVIGSSARFIVNYVVGATVWAEYMPEEFFNMTMTSPWIYSALYNATYIFISMAACLAIEALLGNRLEKFIEGKDLG